MKKHVSLLAVLLFFFFIAQANTVDENEAKNIALNFYKITTGSTIQQASLNYIRKEADGTIDYYIFDISPAKGFVIVSADDNVIPVIAYSTESNFNVNANHTGVVNWLNNTANTIHTTIQQNITADSRIKNLWTSYAAGLNPAQSRASAVAPLLTTSWDQAPYYNQLCPYNSTEQQLAVTGCVATAMAQIMKFWNYPQTGTGSHAYNDTRYGRQTANFGTTYNWQGMPNYLGGNNTAIATLMYHCGVSVEMEYGTASEGGSGAYVLQSETYRNAACAERSFKTYFGYNPNTLQGVHHGDYTDADWIALIKNELDAGRPVQYQGTDPNYGGHTWVCDGYNENNMFHMNWGWGGQDNGYFYLSNLVAGGGQLHFQYDDAALIGIQPATMIELSASASSPVICDGGATDITVTGPANGTYTWTPATGLSCTSCISTTANPANTTTYTITVDSAGVIGKTYVTVTVPKVTTADFNASLLSTCSLPAAVSFTNNSNYTTNYYWDFGDGYTSTEASPIHSYASSNDYTIKLVATGLCGADSVVKNTLINVVDQTPITYGAGDICGGKTATLTASANGQLNWYKTATGGYPIGSGSSFTTPALNKTTTYYVDATVPGTELYAGAVDKTIGTGNYYTGTNQLAMIFNCTTAQTLVSVDVNAKTAGNRTIELLDSNGYQLAVTAVYIPAGDQTVVLNFSLPVGNKMKLSIKDFVDLYRNTSGASYPYLSEDASIQITGSTGNNKNYYYFFYNWRLQQASCVTNRVPAIAQVNTLSSGIKADYTGTQGRTVTFTPVNSSATSFTWNFGDGATSTDKTPTHTYSSTKMYTVTLTESEGTCTDKLEYIVNGATAIEDVSTLVESFKLSPVPTSSLLNVNVQCSERLNRAKLLIYNLLGEVIMSRETDLLEGSNAITLDVAALSAGIYISSLQTGSHVTSQRFIKVD